VKSASLPHVGECTLQLCVLGVACTMRNEVLWGVTEHYGALRDVTERYGSVTKRYGTVTENIDFAHH